MIAQLRPWLAAHRLPLLVLVLYTGLGLVYGLITPPFEMSDATRHYAVVKYMADTGRLPVQEPGEAQRHWSHEGNQPPLYYAMAAALTAWIDTGAWDDVFWYNPHTSVGVPLRHDNENMTIHGPWEAFPWQGYTLAVYLIRAMSLAMGMVTVAFTYRIGMRLFRGRQDLAVLVMAVAAFTPMFIAISAAVNNDNAVIMFCTVATWVLVLMAVEGVTWPRVLWLGVLIGLGGLSKLYALGMLPLAGLVLLWQGWRQQRWRQIIIQGLVLGGVVALIAGWFYLRNVWLYGDPLALEPMRDVAGRRETPLTWSIFWAEFEGFRIAYWALFGGVNVIAHDWIYVVLDVVSLVSVGGVLAWLGVSLGRRRFVATNLIEPAALLVLLGWVGVMVAGFIVWNFTQPASQGRLFFPAIASLSALLVLGLSWWLPQPWTRRPALTLSGGLFVFAALSPLVYIAPAYAKPPRLALDAVPASLPRLDYVFNDELRLIGVEVPPGPYRATETVPVTAYWEVLQAVPVNYSVFIHLYGNGGQTTLGQLDTYPGLGAWPTTLLAPGDVLRDTYPVPLSVAAEAAAPARLQVAVGLYEYDQPGFPRPPVTANGQPIDLPLVGEVKVLPWAWPEVEAGPPLVQFEDGIRLQTLDSSCGPETQTCIMTFTWQSEATPTADYQVFLQLWYNDTQLGGFDAPPRRGGYPSSWWAAGETIVDRHALILPSDMPADAHFRLGLYRLDTGQRLPAYMDGTALPDFALRVRLDGQVLP